MNNRQDHITDTTPGCNEQIAPKGRIHSKDLFGEARELIILHNEEQYHLRITRNRKLILTK